MVTRRIGGALHVRAPGRQRPRRPQDRKLRVQLVELRVGGLHLGDGVGRRRAPRTAATVPPATASEQRRPRRRRRRPRGAASHGARGRRPGSGGRAARTVTNQATITTSMRDAEQAGGAQHDRRDAGQHQREAEAPRRERDERQVGEADGRGAHRARQRAAPRRARRRRAPTATTGRPRKLPHRLVSTDVAVDDAAQVAEARVAVDRRELLRRRAGEALTATPTSARTTATRCRVGLGRHRGRGPESIRAPARFQLRALRTGT